MNKDSIRKNFWHSSTKSVFHLILGRKICILPNFTVKKSVYTDKIRMSGRSGAVLALDIHYVFHPELNSS